MSLLKSSNFRHDHSHELATTQTQSDYRHWEHLVRALSHDMNANFMILESSFSQLSKSIGVCPTEQLLEQAAHVTACLKESQRYLDDLVDLAKTGTVDMEPERVDLRQVIDEVAYAQGDLIRSRKVHLKIEGKLPTLWCNRKRVKQVLTNLIRNAIKHGCDPEIPEITIATTPESNAMACLTVHDNGPGIPTNFQEKIFEPGIRLPNTTSDGTGMGLAIVRRIAEHYGGTTQIESNPEHGTTFLIYLPTPPKTSQESLPSAIEETTDTPKPKMTSIHPAMSERVWKGRKISQP